mmetsp:Transcript_27911/g.38244  ORF Transcript_27911/g.38244 Transcript_27911/m.38244 type:complete len:263 (+) Transcript_27911:3628-4416(+)
MLSLCWLAVGSYASCKSPFFSRRRCLSCRNTATRSIKDGRMLSPSAAQRAFRSSSSTAEALLWLIASRLKSSTYAWSSLFISLPSVEDSSTDIGNFKFAMRRVASLTLSAAIRICRAARSTGSSFAIHGFHFRRSSLRRRRPFRASRNHFPMVCDAASSSSYATMRPSSSPESWKSMSSSDCPSSSLNSHTRRSSAHRSSSMMVISTRVLFCLGPSSAASESPFFGWHWIAKHEEGGPLPVLFFCLGVRSLLVMSLSANASF